MQGRTGPFERTDLSVPHTVTCAQASTPCPSMPRRADPVVKVEDGKGNELLPIPQEEQ